MSTIFKKFLKRIEDVTQQINFKLEMSGECNIYGRERNTNRVFVRRT
jgi:hypothetical protein